MSQSNAHDIKILKGLSQHLQDNAETYREAADEIEHLGYRSWLDARAHERDAMARELKTEVTQRGGTPDEEGSILAKAQRAFKDIKHALLRHDTSLIDSIEASETDLVHRFASAIDDKDLSATTRESLRRAHARILATREQVAELKHSLESQATVDNPLYPS
jgi:uncharacterized protein (TIGR02284 family)